jgi:subtilisin family serine protease
MKTVRKSAITLFASISLLVIAGATLGQTRTFALQEPVLKQRAVRTKPVRTSLSPKVRSDVIVVKFREGTRVRERLGQLEADLTNIAPAEEQLLQRANLSRQRLFQDLAQVNNLVAPNSKRFVRRLFARTEAELDAEKREGESRIGEELADLNLYHNIFIADANPRETERLIDQLNATDSVEIAYAQPIAEPAQADIAPTTPDFTGSQGYVRPAASPTSTTNGIDALYARLFPGGRGAGVKIIDVEQGWNLTHEDLPPVFFQGGPNRGDSGPWNHGTAVLGMLAAGENGYGITGIAPQSPIGVSSAVSRTCILGFCWWSDDFENAVNRAAAQLSIGDIMVLEQHAPGPDSGLAVDPNCNPDQFEFVAMEFWDANFDAIKNATARGIVVVEAAGNGRMDLDSGIYDGKFDRSKRDSGAILVGGGTSAGRAPKCWTNFGSRVDLQGWGENVMTLGATNDTPAHPAIKVNGGDYNQWYTTAFSGTSSATPIVAGAAADLQGFRKARGLGPFTSVEMRGFLRSTGMAQAADSRQIGPLPNLRAAIDAHQPKRTLRVTFLSIKVVDNVFSGPQSLAFNFSVNSSSASTGTMSFPQGVPVNLPANLSLTGQEILNGGITVFVSTNLRSVISFNPKTGAITSVWSRPVQVLHSFAQGTDFSGGSPIIGGGYRQFTDRSTDASGYFEVTYRVSEVWEPVLTQF